MNEQEVLDDLKDLLVRAQLLNGECHTIAGTFKNPYRIKEVSKDVRLLISAIYNTIADTHMTLLIIRAANL